MRERRRIVGKAENNEDMDIWERMSEKKRNCREWYGWRKDVGRRSENVGFDRRSE